MEIDFDDVENLPDYVTVPAGTYLCKVAEVRPGVTRSGDERWGLRLVVAEGEYTGRLAAWDGITFSAKGRARARRVLAALGLPHEGRVEIQPEDVAGRSALVTIRPSEYPDPNTGDVVRRNEVPYDGYRRVPDDEDKVPGSPVPGSPAPRALDHPF